MSLISDITTIITEQYPDATFNFSSKFKASRTSFDIEAAALPFIVLDNEISKDGEVAINNNIKKNTKIVISCLYLDSFENSDLEMQTLVNNAETILDRIAAIIYQLIPVRPLNRQRYKITPAFHFLSTNLTGATLEMFVNYNQVVNFEFTPVIDDEVVVRDINEFLGYS